MDDVNKITPQLDGWFDQNKVFAKALNLYDERSEAYGEVWKNYGALSNLLSAARKVDRLMEVWWSTSTPVIHKSALDDAYDAINYLAFFIRNCTEGNFSGYRPQRPEDISAVVAWVNDNCEELVDLTNGLRDAKVVVHLKDHRMIKDQPQA